MKDIITLSEVITREEFKSGQLKLNTPHNLKTYFEYIKDRFDHGEQYPYDIEELVGIAFASKQKAVEALEKDFSQPIDFIRSTIRLSGNPTPKDVYKLAPLTFEFMVARRCLPVFEIYHKIFHAVASAAIPQPTTPAQMFVLVAQQFLEYERRLLGMETKQQELEHRLDEALPRDQYITILGLCTKYHLQMTTEDKRLLGIEAGKYCRQHNLMIDQVPDKRYGTVNAYPEFVLCELLELESLK